MRISDWSSDVCSSDLNPPPSTRPDGIVDLQSFMAERLRSEVERLKGQQRAIISATRANHNSQNRVHAAILFLLDAENFEQLIQTITTDLALLLELDLVRSEERRVGEGCVSTS